MTSSSSDFSSDEEDALMVDAGYEGQAYADHTVDMEVVEEAEEELQNAAELLDAVKSELSATVVEAIASLLQPNSTVYAYEAYTTALYYLSSQWPEAPSVQRRMHQLRGELYRRFHALYPLTSEMYQEWISDKESMAEQRRLYALSTQDYWSVALTTEHLQRLNENEDEEGITWEVVETAMEESLRTVGQHYTQGHEIWKLCREITSEHFDTLDGDNELDKEQAIRALYVRQMAIPLQQNDLIMSEFRAWNQYNTHDAIERRDQAIQTAEDTQQRVFGPVQKKMNQFEERLAATVSANPPPEETSEQVWLQYLNFGMFRLAPLFKDTDDAHVFMCGMFERAIAMVCLSAALWRKYLEYVMSRGENMTNSENRLGLCRRAVRNVSFDSSMWVDLLLLMESNAASLSEIIACLQKDILARTAPPLMDSAHSVQVLRTVSGVARRLTSTLPTEQAIVAIGHIFALSRSFIESAFPQDSIALASVLEVQAQCYSYLCSKSSHAKTSWSQCWHDILACRGNEAEIWLRYEQEFRFVHSTDPALTRLLREQVFVPAAERVLDYPLSIVDRWLMFELAAGDLVQYESVRQQHVKLSDKLQKQATEAQLAAAESTDYQPQNKKRKAASTHVESSEKRQDKRAKTDRSQEQQFTDDFTLFVCNLSKDATQDEVEALFRHIPSLKDVRLVVKERATHVKSRGMAYVQFHNEEGVAAGLNVNGVELHGQTIKVERSTPPANASSTSKSAASVATTLYVGGMLPPERDPITEDEVQTAINQVMDTPAAVKQVLILRDRRDKPKDYALVEFLETRHAKSMLAKSKVEALKAILGEQITVQTSRMSIAQVVRHRDEQKEAVQKRKETTKKPVAAKTKPPRSQGKAAPHAKPVTRLAIPPVGKPSLLMPRALQKKAPAAAATGSAGSGAQQPSAPKTNDDFRKLFMKSST
ncbi:hypothetical protein Poli38472_013757 [Pythium oligandrum]|uniref:RRM domain-containing protein n=1 Tax=Pythium oligandrum TaxID=41045 RepID=A0A8K1CDY5_PYTOL|nr:hypothetical protein Poli38472_013757 [Pythium oligandrum]|eukprot:TMW61294.1 hypothetical protein Poli38472_013757 [Pythium oligandrum]